MGPSGRPVENFSPYCEGDIDPSLNKRIHTLIDSEDRYIVYLDDEFNVMWSMTGDWEEPAVFGKIANRVTHLEAVSEMILPLAKREPLRRMLGEAAARAIGEGDAKQAEASLSLAETFLLARGTERARLWYFGAAATVSIASALFFALLWIGRAPVSSFIGRNGFEILTGALLGGVGAFFAIMMSSKTSKFDASAGPWIHLLDGGLRIGTGIAGALLLSFAIKGNIVFGIAKTFDNPLAVLYALCLAAGWSERLGQTLVVRVEGLVSGREHTNKVNQDDRKND